MGPGQASSTLGSFDPRIKSIYSSLSTRLASQHSLSVCHFTWRCPPTRKGAPPGTLKSPSTLSQGARDVALAVRFLRKSAHEGDSLPLVLCGFSFGSPAVLAAAALSCHASRATPPHTPSRGGGVWEGGEGDEDDSAERGGSHDCIEKRTCTDDHDGHTGDVNRDGSDKDDDDAATLSAARDTGQESSEAHGANAGQGEDLGPLAGVVSLSGGLRVAVDGSPQMIDIGERLRGGVSRSRPKDYSSCDSESCVRALAEARIPLLLTHGLSDVTVDPRASQAIFDAATGPKAMLWFENADHHYRARFAKLLEVLGRWVPALVDIELRKMQGCLPIVNEESSCLSQQMSLTI